MSQKPFITLQNLFTSKMEEPSPKKLKKDDCHPADSLRALARKLDMPIDSLEFARYMDENDPIRHLRKEFHYPKMKELHESKRKRIHDYMYMQGF